MELIKPITKLGNSSKVLLPKEWMGGVARVELIEKPLNITDDVLKILKPYLRDILGIYLAGSYARNEQIKYSDIDILVISQNLDKKIKKGKYNIIIISEKNIKKLMKQNILPILPMIRESKPILNEALIEKYKRTKPNKKNTRAIIEITISSRKVCKKSIEISKELSTLVSDEVMYSIILGLRTIYVINCLKQDKIPTTKGLKNLVIKLANSEEPYKSYLRIKNNQNAKSVISSEVAEKLNEYVSKRL